MAENDHEQDTCQSGLRCENRCELVPVSSGVSREISDAVYHFCGPDCLERWQKRQSSAPAPE